MIERCFRICVFVAMMCGSLSLMSGQEPQWKVFGHLKEGRTLFGTALIGQGKVLVIGGFTQQKGLQSERLRGVVSNSCEIIDILAHQIIAAPSTVVPHSASVILTMKDSNIVVVSGLTTDSTTTPICEMYDRKRNNWRVLGSLIWGRHAHSAVFINDEEILVVGGHPNFNYAPKIAEAEIFNIRTGRSRSINDFPCKIVGPCGVESRFLARGKPIFFGGRSGGERSYQDAGIYSYDAMSERWFQITRLPGTAHTMNVARLFDGRLIAAGGVRWQTNARTTSANQLIALETETGFSVVGTKIKPLIVGGIGEWNNEIILFFGGHDETRAAQAYTEWFDLKTYQSLEGPPLKFARFFCASVSVPTFDERGNQRGACILAIAGEGTENRSLSSVEILETTNPQLLEIPNSEIASQRLKQLLTSPAVIATLAIFILVLITGLLYLLYQVLAIRRQSKFSYQSNAVEGQK